MNDRLPVRAVVDPHDDAEHGQAERRPHALLDQEQVRPAGTARAPPRADALYTMTMLSADEQQRRDEQHLVGLELSGHRVPRRRRPPLQPDRARPETMPGRRSARTGIAVSGQQSSVGLGPRHQLRRPGQPAFPAASPPPREPTDDCSLLTRRAPLRSAASRRHLLLEHAARAPRSRGTCRSSRTPARAAPRPPASPARTPARPRSSSVAASCTGDGARQRLAHQRPRLADRDDAPSRAPRAARAAAARSPPLNRPPMIGTSPRSKLSIDRRAASTLVAFESLTNRTPPTSPPSSIACSRPRNASTAARHRRRRRAGDRADRRRRHHVGHQVRPEQVDRRRAARARVVAARRAVDDPAVRRRPCPRRSRAGARTAALRARAAPRELEHRRVVGVDHRPVVRRPGSRRSAPSPPRTPRRSGADRGGRARSSASPRSTDGTCRSARAESCSPRRRAACPASTRPPAR